MNNKELYWLLGTDDALNWHQRIILSPSLRRAQSWWKDSLGRDAEIALDLETLEDAIHVLTALSQGDLEQKTNSSLYAVWVKTDESLSIYPIEGESPQDAQERAQNEGLEVLAVVHAWPLLDGLARMRAIAQGDLPADEVLH